MKRTNVKQKPRKGIIFEILLLFVTLLAMSPATHAQVTIGAGEAPISGALLQLKDKGNVSGDMLNAHKGLALPRVTLSDKKELYPMFLANPDDSTSGPNSDYSTNKATLDKTHTGLIVYNLVEDDEKELCLGLNQWDGEQWICFEHKLGNAIGHIVSCDEFKIFGHYKSPDAYPTAPSDDVSLDASNFITIKLQITKPGAYAITITPKYAAALNNETNGYFFVANGIFMEKGTYTVAIPGAGTPFWYTPPGNPGDELTATMNGKPLTLENGTPCPKNIEVEDYSKKPNYTMDCARTTVHGVYVLNRNLNPADNYISVWITMDPSDPFVEGSIVYLETNQVDGISFASTPAIITNADKSAGQKQIILRGTGKPTSVETKRVTISSNSAISVATCYANITVAYTKKKILGIKGAGGADYYGYGLGSWSGTYASMSNIYGLGGRKMLMSDVNFGTTSGTSTVKIEGYEFVDAGNLPSASRATLQSLINTHKPDIIVIGYDYAPDNSTVDVLIDYMSKKGVVIAAMENPGAVERLFNRTLNLPAGTVSAGWRGGAGSIYEFNYMTSDEILNGPFGDVREKNWGEDASTTVGVTGVPFGLVDIYSDGHYKGVTTGSNSITICKFKGNNLVWLGDGGFWSRAISSADVNSNTICPLYYNNDFSPTTGTFGVGSNNSVIYNSYFFVNMMAWAIKTAQFDGYNTPR